MTSANDNGAIGDIQALGAGIRLVRKRLGKTTTWLSEESGGGKSGQGYISQLERGEKEPSQAKVRAIEAALKVPRHVLERLGRGEIAIEDVELDAGFAEPSRPASESVSGVVKSYPLDSGVLSDGTVVGPITYDAIKDPTGKGGMVLKLGHSRRGKKRDTIYGEVPRVPPSGSVVLVRERVEVHGPEGIDSILEPGTVLIVDPSAPPSDGQLVLVAKNIDWSADVEAGDDAGLAGVKLMRYREAVTGNERIPIGWPLDNDRRKKVDLEGWYSLVATVIGRWNSW